MRSQLWLLLNVKTSVGGYVVAELQDATGTPLPGYTQSDAVVVKGNAIRAPLAWATPGAAPVSDLAVPSAGGATPLVLVLSLKHATVYAWDLQCVQP